MVSAAGFDPAPVVAGRPARGRKRSPETHLSILQSTIRLLSRYSYQSLTLERIAEDAGVGKATIYRWWKTKGALVGEALAWHLKPSRAPETGSPEGDLRQTIDATVRNYSGSLAGVTVPAVAADMVNDPDLRTAFLRDFLGPRRAVARASVEAVVAAGILPPDLDVELVMDMWAGAIFYRTLLSDQPVNPNFTDQFVDLLLHRRLPTTGG